MRLVFFFNMLSFQDINDNRYPQLSIICNSKKCVAPYPVHSTIYTSLLGRLFAVSFWPSYTKYVLWVHKFSKPSVLIMYPQNFICTKSKTVFFPIFLKTSVSGTLNILLYNYVPFASCLYLWRNCPSFTSI